MTKKEKISVEIIKKITFFQMISQIERMRKTANKNDYSLFYIK